jgi:hypothetical protein
MKAHHVFAQVRLLAVIEILADQVVFGVRLCEVVKMLGCPVSPSTVLRDLQTLKTAGYAQQTKDGRWTLAAKPYLHVLRPFYCELEATRIRVTEIVTNYTRIPNFPLNKPERKCHAV